MKSRLIVFIYTILIFGLTTRLLIGIVGKTKKRPTHLQCKTVQQKVPITTDQSTTIIKETIRPRSGEALFTITDTKKVKKRIPLLNLPSGPFREMQGCFNCNMDSRRGSLCCLCPYTSRLFKHPLAPAPVHPFPEVKTACMSLKEAQECDGNIWFCPATSKSGKVIHRLECNFCRSV